MKTIYSIILCSLLFSFTAAAQQKNNLRVLLAAGKNDSLHNISIQLYALPDTTLISTQVSRQGGNEFSVDRFSKYLIRTSGIGYREAERTVASTDKPLTVTLQLKRSTTSLEGVTVVARKPLVKQEDDKTVVDAEVLASSSTNAYEVLEKTPGAIVDQDGNVYLSSATPATIQINGREVKLSAADLASLLKSLPAGSVSKIEILRNPSAKFDAASSGGIVNIVLKKGVKLGTSGSANIGWFQGVYNTKFAGFNINKGDDKLSSYFSYQFTSRNNYEELISSRFVSSGSSTLSQRAYTTYPGINNYFGAGFDYEVNKKLSFGYDLRVVANNNKSNASNRSLITSNGSGLVNADNESVINNKGNSTYIGNNVSGKYKIDTLGSEWTAQVDLNFYNNRNAQDYLTQFLVPASNPSSGDGNTKARKNIIVAQTDLVLKLKKQFNIEMGLKATISDSRNMADYFKEINGSGRKIDSFQTNTFKYKETISSAYLQIAKTIWGFNIKPGIRMETTDINGRQIFPKDTSLSIRRTDFFPYLFLRHRIMKLMGFELNGNLVYRRSITRPYYESLNPYPKYIDQYLFDVGNPRLKPQFTTNYEFNIIADDFPIFSIGVNETKDIFSNVTYQVDSIAFRTFDNLGKSKELYLRIVGGIPPGGKFFFYAGAQHNFNEYEGVYQGRPLAYKRGSWSFFTYQNFKATPTLTFSLHGFMRTKGLQNFYELKNFGSLTMSVNKSIMKKKANLILAVNDIFRTNHVDFSLDQGGVTANGSRYNDTRRVGLTFRYNFGIKPKEDKQNFEQPAEGNN